MKKRYILVLSLIFIVLSLSYVSASDNGTDVVKQNDNDIAEIEESVDEVSLKNQEDDSNLQTNENAESKLGYSNDENLSISYDSEDNLLTSSGGSSSSDSDTVAFGAGPTSATVYKEPTKKQRTFKIGKFKAVLSKKQYKKLFKVSSVEDYYLDCGYNDYYDDIYKFKGYWAGSSGLHYHIKVKTNKIVKVKVRMGNKIKIKKSRVYMDFTYGEGQSGVPYRHMIYLSHNYDNPGYDGSKVLSKTAKYFKKCKVNFSFEKLKKSKLISQNTAYKRYASYYWLFLL